MTPDSSLVLYSENHDPLVQACLGSMRNLPTHHVMHIDELLEYLEPVSWPEVLCINLPETIQNAFKVDIIVNRLFTLADTQTAMYLKERGIDERWFHIRLARFLKYGKELAYDCGLRGVSRSILPLNLQWFYVAHTYSGVSVPHFDYAFGSEEPDLSMISNPMQKSVWSLFDWKEEHHAMPAEARRHRFTVERPTGTPVVLYYLGDDFSNIVYPMGFQRIRDDIIKDVVALCKDVFRSNAGEVLLYVTNVNDACFYAFSPFLNSAAGDSQFQQYVTAWLGLTSVSQGEFERSGPAKLNSEISG